MWVDLTSLFFSPPGIGFLGEFHKYLLNEVETLWVLPQYIKGYGFIAP
ncbi:MAG: hypothetical protein ACJAUP_002998 [Cellvibrionaceae bacterium]|jgi:hypothetical protein